MSAAQPYVELASWIGRREVRGDTIGASPLAELAALLDRDDPPPKPGDAVPALAHWLYFLPTDRQSELGADGHARRGGFLPPVPLPRRMWAGSRLEFLRPLTVGSVATRTSTIRDVRVKEGRSGPLVFVTVRHEIADAHGIALTDEHDIVYRGDGVSRAAPLPAPETAAWRREVLPDAVLLFRYSAVTYNGHRIHYDRPYATQVEGYPGLVVHGPLLATLLVDLLRRHRPGAVLMRYAFRALRPSFDIAPVELCGTPDEAARTARLWTRDAEGALTMRAEAEWRP